MYSSSHTAMLDAVQGPYWFLSNLGFFASQEQLLNSDQCDLDQHESMGQEQCTVSIGGQVETTREPVKRCSESCSK